MQVHDRPEPAEEGAEERQEDYRLHGCEAGGGVGGLGFSLVVLRVVLGVLVLRDLVRVLEAEGEEEGVDQEKGAEPGVVGYGEVGVAVLAGDLADAG